jgi:hypothetical protein
MGAADEAATFEPREVAPDAGRGGTGDCKQFLDGCGSSAQEEFDNLLGTVIQRIWHRTDSILLSAQKRNLAMSFRDLQQICW